MKSQIKWLIPKYYKEGECIMAPCYLEAKHIYDEHYPEIKITKENAELLLYDSEDDAVKKLKIMLEELIPEYERRINNIKKYIKTR